jgi:uncharacterized protein
MLPSGAREACGGIVEETEINEVLGELRSVLRRRPEVAAAWLHGSALRGEPAADVDVAVLVAPGQNHWRVVRAVVMELSDPSPAGLPYDLRPIDSEAPPELRFRVVREGVLIVEHDADARVLFQADAARDYLDIEPFLRRARRDFIESLAGDHP